MKNTIMKKSRNYSKLDVLVSIILFYSNLTYIPFLTSNPLIRPLTYLLWGMLFIYVLFQKIIITKDMYFYIGSVAIFNFYVMTMHITSSNHYINSRFVYPVNLILFVFLVGAGIAQSISKEKLEIYFKSYLSSSFLLGIIIYFQFFRGTNWINSMSYLVVQKNGIAMIFLISIILIFYLKDCLSSHIKIILLFEYSIILVMLKSRATIIGLFLIIGYGIVKSKNKNKYLLSIVIIFWLLSQFTNIPEYLIYNLLLNNRSDMGLDAMTSGRLGHFNTFIDNFFDYPVLGRGSYYLESFPLASLMTYGIVGSIPLFTLSFLPLFSAIGSRKRFDNLNLEGFLVAIWIVYFFNGFFEELAPFGPGVKCYILWLLTGIYLGNTHRNKIKSLNSKEKIKSDKSLI